jgi:hypothetical protein
MLLLLPPLKNIQTPIGGLDQLYWFPADKARAGRTTPKERIMLITTIHL